MQPAEELLKQLNALENALDESKRRIASLELIQEISKSLTAELNLEPLLHRILATAVEVTNSSAGSLLLLDESTDELVFAVVEGGGGPTLEGVRMSRSAGIAGWVATHRQPLIVDDVNKDTRHYQSIAENFNLKFASLLCVPMLLHSRLIGVLQVARTNAGHYFGPEEQNLLVVLASKAAIAIENARLYESLKEERDKLVEVEDEIRKRLARDLHDGPTQFVSSTILSLNLAKQLMSLKPELAPREIDRAISLSESGLKQLRTLLFDLRPVILETQGLIPALELYTERLIETDALNIILTIEDEFNRLSSKAEIAIFAVIQEAVNNAKKHAEAPAIEIKLGLDKAGSSLVISVEDNGAGFDVQDMNTSYDKQGSLGMINMQERIDSIHGSFKIQSTVGEGTKVILTVPLEGNLLNNPRAI